MSVYRIAGLVIPLVRIDAALLALDEVYSEFQARADAYANQGENPHLCAAGCSHCCRSGALFALTLAEAVNLTIAIGRMETEERTIRRNSARDLIELQHNHFPTIHEQPDEPGARDDELFTRRVAQVNRIAHPHCPLLGDDLCRVYDNRPFLCRAYGYPVDALAIETAETKVFRSLCHLYEGLSLTDYVRAHDLRGRLKEISNELAGGHDIGRFTSAEAILADLSPCP